MENGVLCDVLIIVVILFGVVIIFILVKVWNVLWFLRVTMVVLFVIFLYWLDLVVLCIVIVGVGLLMCFDVIYFLFFVFV